jgi:hypothetical protein
MGGFILARGTEQQIDSVRRSKEFRQIMARTRLAVDDLVIVDAYVDESLGQLMQEYEEEVNRLD